MKGCVRGYGNYEELTSSGVDPTELFDDIEGSIKPPDLLPPDEECDEECDDIVEEEPDQQDSKSLDHIHPLPIITELRRRVRSESVTSNFDPVFDEVSLYNTPSLVSIPDDFDKNENQVGTYSHIFLISFRFLHRMLYRRKREHMELFLTKLIMYTCGKEQATS